MTNATYRQGDVFLKASNQEIPAGSQKVAPVNGRLILALGDATGHSHTVTSDTCEMYKLPNGIVLVVRNETPVMHQEHNEINIAPGIYWVLHQREYSPEEIRKVID